MSATTRGRRPKFATSRFVWAVLTRREQVRNSGESNAATPAEARGAGAFHRRWRCDRWRTLWHWISFLLFFFDTSATASQPNLPADQWSHALFRCPYMGESLMREWHKQPREYATTTSVHPPQHARSSHMLNSMAGTITERSVEGGHEHEWSSALCASSYSFPGLCTVQRRSLATARKHSRSPSAKLQNSKKHHR